MINREDEHDITKGMLNTLRESQIKKYPKALSFLNENNGFETSADSVNPTDNEGTSDSGDDTIQPSPDEVSAEQDKFSDIVDEAPEFTVFNLYPKTGNAVFGGKCFDGKLEWQFTLESQSGPFITTNNLQMNSEMIAKLGKMMGYYQGWVKEWGKKMRDEYRKR